MRHGAGGGRAVTVALLKLRQSFGNAVAIAGEVEVFFKLGRHPNLTPLLGMTTHPDGSDCMLVEFAELGSLDNLLVQKADEGVEISEAVRITIAMQICDGMSQLAEYDVVHRDLACRNVLVFRFSPVDRAQVLVKVTDYGLALLDGGGTRGVTTHSGSDARPVRWLAPEALRTRRYSRASDVWAFGVTLWELWSDGMVPYWEVPSDEEVVRRVGTQGVTLGRPENCIDAVWRVMEGCWARIAKDRPQFQPALKVLLQDAYAASVRNTSQRTCAICWEREPVIALQPCGHRSLCEECAPEVQTCPICRSPVAERQRIYDS
jgi:serine/threonine protein kinase